LETYATITTKMKVVKLRAEPKTTGTVGLIHCNTTLVAFEWPTQHVI